MHPALLGMDAALPTTPLTLALRVERRKRRERRRRGREGCLPVKLELSFGAPIPSTSDSNGGKGGKGEKTVRNC
ncbi:hypothetical protein ACQP3D_27945, partial [Escherichia coli]